MLSQFLTVYFVSFSSYRYWIIWKSYRRRAVHLSGHAVADATDDPEPSAHAEHAQRTLHPGSHATVGKLISLLTSKLFRKI